MRAEGSSVILDLEGNTTSPDTLKTCLEYLYKVAVRSGFKTPAHLIGAAAMACDDIIAEDEKDRKEQYAVPVAIKEQAEKEH